MLGISGRMEIMMNLTEIYSYCQFAVGALMRDIRSPAVCSLHRFTYSCWGGRRVFLLAAQLICQEAAFICCRLEADSATSLFTHCGPSVFAASPHRTFSRNLHQACLPRVGSHYNSIYLAFKEESNHYLSSIFPNCF